MQLRILCMLSCLLTDAFLLAKFREVLQFLRFGNCGKYAKRQKAKKKYASMRRIDRLTLTPLVRTSKQADRAKRIQTAYLIYAGFAIVSCIALLAAALFCVAANTVLYIWYPLFGIRLAFLLSVRFLYFSHGIARTPTV